MTLACSAKHLLPPVDGTLNKVYNQARPPTPKNKKRKLSVSGLKRLASPSERTSASLFSRILLVNDRINRWSPHDEAIFFSESFVGVSDPNAVSQADVPRSLYSTQPPRTNCPLVGPTWSHGTSLNLEQERGLAKNCSGDAHGISEGSGGRGAQDEFWFVSSEHFGDPN